MLEQMRRQGASTLIYALFIILIAGMVYSLAPSHRGDVEGGCSPSSNVVLAVDGADANQTAYMVAYSANGGKGRQKVYFALDAVVRREILAQAAAAQGIRATGDLVDDEMIRDKRGYFFLGGQRLDFTQQFFDEVEGDRFFNVKRWKAWVGQLNVSPGSYREDQARGLQAAMLGELVTSSVRVSREEALANYLYENNTVTYDVVAFDPAKYRRAMRLTDADTKRFLDGHAAEVEARYKADERTYKGVKPQLELREIFIPKAAPEAAKPAPPADKADKAKPDDKTKPADDKAKKPAAGDAPKPVGLPIDVAKAKLDAVRAEIAAGKLTFSDAETRLAADASDDAAAENGDRGWHSADNTELGEKPVNDAAKLLKPGEMTPVITTARGVYLVVATAKREGDLGFDQVKAEIAAALAKDVWSKEAAKRDALDTLAKAEAGTGKNLDQMFEHELVKPSNGFEELLNDPSLTPAQKQQLIQQLLQQQQKHGSLDVHEQDVPVAWFADADGSAHAAPAAGSNAAPAAGSNAAPAAGSNAAPAAGSNAAPAAAAAPAIEPSKDVLPPFVEVPKAKVNRLGPTPRQTKMPGIGGAKDANNALFDELAPGNLAKKVYDDAGTYLVVQLINRSQPNVEDFDKTADAELARMQQARGKAALSQWLKNRCDVLNKAGKIKPAADKIRETDDKGNPAPTVYRPCMEFDAFDR